MPLPEPYRIPIEINRTTTTVANSRFITTIGRVETVEQAKQFLADCRIEMPDAAHHVYAFRIGYGRSITEGMSDDGEPSGTSGPPILAVIRGTDIGDIIIVVTRYFGGTKLGTGGLVRAYTEAAQFGLQSLKTELKIARQILGLEVSYSLYEIIKRIIIKHNGNITDESFEAAVTIMAVFAVDDIPSFSHEISEATAGRLQPVIMGDV